MKIWVVEQQVSCAGEWETDDWGYYSSRKKAELAIRKRLVNYPMEIVNTAYEKRIEDDFGFLMTLPEIKDQWALRYHVDCRELDEELWGG